jgi:chromosome partitioning protein
VAATTGDWVACSTCDKRFVPRFTYQTDRSRSDPEAEARYYCSIRCRSPELREGSRPPGPAGAEPTEALGAEATCAVCGRSFEVLYAYQVLAGPRGKKSVCSKPCRTLALPSTERVDAPRAHAVAVLNQKGGTGKTTTAVSLAAALAEDGLRVLLVDLDAQGNVAVSFGVQHRRSLYHVIVDGADPASLWVEARPGLFVLPSDQSLAAAEIELVSAPDRARVLERRLAPVRGQFDVLLLDCAPSLSLLNQNALVASDQVLIPVSCDYLALVGVRQILRTVQHVRDVLLHPIEVLGVLPTLYDGRNRISKHSVEALHGYFGEKVLPPIRINARLKEAPSHKQTIFEYAPDSNGAADYRAAKDWVRSRLFPAETSAHVG